MTVKDDFDCYFSKDSLKNIFEEVVSLSSATGIDNLDPYSFRFQVDQHIEIVSRKVRLGTYKFSKYKLKLISKGRGKVPREISVPTVRDRIALRALCDFLTDRFKSATNLELPQDVILRVKQDLESSDYTACIKLDVSNFYPSIKHSELIPRLRKRIKDDSVLSLVKSAISTPTVSHPSADDKPATVGIPQGLAISNILAATYLLNIDRRYLSMPNISYYRYVDDVLIFCDMDSAHEIVDDVLARFRKIGLKIHDPKIAPEKSSIGEINRRFDYLGYLFNGPIVSARQGTINKLRESIVKIFTAYKYSKKKDQNFLLWRLNLRITGCIYENKSKGWLFFFSEINDESLLHSLDHFVTKLSKRFGVQISPKKFSRTFYEMKHKRYESNYIPNFDIYDLADKKYTLAKYFGVKLEGLQDVEIEFEFRKRISKQAKELLEDVRDFTY